MLTKFLFIRNLSLSNFTVADRRISKDLKTYWLAKKLSLILIPCGCLISIKMILVECFNRVSVLTGFSLIKLIFPPFDLKIRTNSYSLRSRQNNLFIQLSGQTSCSSYGLQLQTGGRKMRNLLSFNLSLLVEVNRTQVQYKTSTNHFSVKLRSLLFTI